MNKTNHAIVRALVFVMLATVTVQMSVSAEAQAPQKRVVKIDESTGELVDISQAQEAPAASAPAATPGIVILNNQKSTQVSGQASKQQASQATIQDQPTNVIEDTPLNASAADRRRRDRQNLEMQTEQKIVEKLEDARMEDERSRGERLFNKGFSSRDHEAPAPQQVQVIQAPVVEKKEEPKVNVREEIRAALDEMKPKSEAPMTEYYIQGLAGMGEYPDARNMKGKMALGFAAGIVTPERIVAEGAFQYSQYDIDRNNSSSMGGGYYDGLPFKKLSQYNFQGALKYQLLSGKVRPVIGAIAAYTYRSYEFQYGYGYYSGGNNASTNSFDVGALAGLDIHLTDTFSIGADVRYFTNVAHRDNSDYSNSYSYYGYVGKRVEEFNYYIASIVGRFTF